VPLCDDAAVVAAVFDQFRDWVSGRWWSYLAIFAVSAIDAFFPLVPSETVVITAGNLASTGDLVLPLVILSAAAGAVVGDNISYFIGKWAGERTVRRLFRSEKAHRGFDWAEEQLERRGFYIIVIARFIPGGRTAVTFTSGYTQGMPWRKFIVADVVAGLVWATYAAMLGYVGGKTFEEQPWKGLLLGFAIALGVALLVEAIRHFRNRRQPA
jgi:membrane protein DedA with SNARE-associated domain